MDIKLIAYPVANTSCEQRPTITTIAGLENMQVCYFDKYRTQLESVAKACNASEIEVFDKQCKYKGTVKNGKITINLN